MNDDEKTVPEPPADDQAEDAQRGTHDDERYEPDEPKPGTESDPAEDPHSP